MIRAFLLLVLTLPILCYTQSYTVTEGSSAALVAGAVNAITGEHYVAESDYQVQAAVPLTLPRVYISGLSTNNHVGWQLFQHLYAAYYIDEREDPFRHEIRLIEPNGTLLVFERSQKIRRSKPIIFNPINTSAAKGLTNVGRGKISGQTNLKNIRVEMQHDKKQFTVYASDGAIRFYKKTKKDTIPMYKDRFPYAAHVYYTLQWEKLPNQTMIFYGYDGKDSLDVVRTANHNNSKTYAQANLHYIHHHVESKPDFNINTNDGRSLSYRFLQRKGLHLLANIETPAYPQESASYNQKVEDESGLTIGRLMNIRCLREGRHYKLDYYMPGNNHVGNANIKLGRDDPRLYRVKTLSAPVGTDATAHVTHRFFYYPDQHYTQVREIDDIVTKYHYSLQQRLERIYRFDKGKVPYNSERFIWGNEGPFATNLLCHTIYEASDTPVLSKRYAYDGKGNVVEEKLYGQLSGTSATPLMIGGDGFPIENGVESYSIRKTYSQDNLNLLVREEHPNGKSIFNIYLPNTSLLSAQFICEHNQIRIRHFYQYSPDYILWREVVDDGSTNDINDLTNVKTRRIKHISLMPQGQTYQDMPQMMDERYWDGQHEILLKRVYLTYTTGGLIHRKDIHDATGHRYSLIMNYDAAGRLINETNPIQQTAVYNYDGVGNKIFSQDFSGKKTTHMKYDYSNRLIAVEEIGSDGLRRLTQHQYDGKHNRISTIDPYGNQINFAHDPFGNILVKHSPSIPTKEGSLTPSISHHRYDKLNREISTTEVNGDVIHKTYNCRDQITHILYPDHTSEHFIYNLDGTLRTHINQKGDQTHYTYDFLGRMTSKIDALGQTTTYTYDAFNLIDMTDAEGNVTTYEYDAAGRKIAEEINHERTEYSYDYSGRVHIVKKGKLLKITEYDLLDRIIEERQTDLDGTVLTEIKYEYDSAGNKASITRNVDGKEAQELFTYDSFNRLTRRQDPLGHVTTTTYNDNYKNAHGQTVTQKIEIDPLGLATITTYDIAGHVTAIEKRKETDSLSIEESFYDASGNLVFHTKNRQSTTEWIYGPLNRLKALIEGGVKITEYTYTPTGQLQSKKKPDGILLTYKYDPLDQLIEQVSSDGSINYTYTYNRIGQQIETHDNIHKKTSRRVYDPCGRLLQEKLFNGLVLTSTYDQQGRKTLLTLPDRSFITYTYDALYLKTISYQGLTHYLTAYDLSGNLLQQKLLGNLGELTFSYDPLGRKTTAKSRLNSQDVQYDPVGNVTYQSFNREKENYHYDALYQLTSEKNHTYTYDSHGNRIYKDGESYTHNQLYQVVSHFDYDQNGNPYSDHETIYTYDALDRLIKLQTPQHLALFAYDDKGRLSHQTIDGTETLLFYDESKEIGLADTFGRILQYRILNPMFPSERGAAVLLFLQGDPFYPQHDLFGNVKTLYDLQGNLIESYNYSAFGEGMKPSLNPWQYASKRSFPELNTIYFGKRFYQPTLGRWLTPDPAGFIDNNTHLYLFVENNPFSKFDLYGLNFMDFYQHYEHKAEPPSSDTSPITETPRIHPHAWEGTKELIENPRIQGGVQMAAGYAEASVGAGLCATPLAPLGAWMVIHGTDRSISGMHSLISGEYQRSLTSQLIERAGAPSHIANTLDDLISVGGIGKAAIVQSEFMAYSSTRLSVQITQESLKRASTITQPPRLKAIEDTITQSTNKPITSNKSWPCSCDGLQIINNIEYIPHALDRMAPSGLIQKGTEIISRGIPPSVVENAIKFGIKVPGNTSNEIVHIFENVRVVTNAESTRVITVIKTGH